MNCQAIQNQFDDRLDQRLDAAAAAAFEAHLTACPACRQAWAQETATWQLLTRATSLEPSHGFADRTLRRLHEQLAPRVTGQLWRWLALGTALIIATAGGLLTHHRAQQTQRAALYAAIQNNDYLEDFDVVANLHDLNQ